MHSGRYCPRVHPFVLSDDCVPPYFPPREIGFAGTMEIAGEPMIVPQQPFVSAVVDDALMTITWEGTFLSDGGQTITWKLVQDRAGVTWPLRVGLTISNGLLAMQSVEEKEPLTFAWSAGITTDPSGHAWIYPGAGWIVVQIDYFSKQWR